MSALPARLVLGPEMMNFGISVASVALAEGPDERDAALTALFEVIREVRQTFKASAEADECNQLDVSETSADELCLFLDRAADAERASFLGQAAFQSLLMRPKFQSMIQQEPNSPKVSELWEFLREWHELHVLFIRRTRMVVIKEVYSRAENAGIIEAHLDEDFPEFFVALSLDEADSWSETAHILASTKNVQRLLSSAGLKSGDRADEIPIHS